MSFQWQGKMYMFTVLPFGCSAAPWYFSKVTRVLVKYWRRQGIRCSLYMVDGSAGGQPRGQAKIMARQVKSDVERAGFIVHEQ